MFLAGGTSWYSWATSTVLVDPEVNEPLTFTLTNTTDEEGNPTGWTFARISDDKFTFISGANPSGAEAGSGEMHVDMASQGHNYFELLKQESGYYHIRAVASDANYGSTMEGYDEKCWGWQGAESTFPFAVYGTVSPAAGYYCDWQFIDMTVYQARVTLYNTLVESETYTTVDNSAASAVYNNEASTLEEIQAAQEALAADIATAKIYAVLNGATEEDPKDGTSLLVNPDFSLGDISGWTCTFKKDENATNIGYQSASYTNTSYTYVNKDGAEVNPNCNKFIEAWAAPGANFNTNITFRAIGDAELSQTLNSLPAGKYKITCDAIAVQQDNAVKTVTGVQLFAIGGDIDLYKEISTGNALPEHVELTFVSSGGDITMGLRTSNATANWIAADNFELTYYGEVSEDPYKVILDGAIATYEATYPDMEEVKANNDVKSAYEEALAAAKAETEDYQSAKTALDAAAEALATSVSEYQSVAITLDDINAKIGIAEEYKWNDLIDNLSDYRDNLQGEYEEGTLTSESIATIAGTINTLIGDYLSENAKAGDDVTILLNNPGYDIDFSGWDVAEGSVTPAFGGLKKNPEGTYTEGAEGLTSGCAEVYHAAFDISQTIKQMPRGLYTLSCQAFERDETGAIDAELYAVVNGETQTVKLMSINDDASEEALYVYGSETPDGNSDRVNDAGLYIPDGMSGANQHFAAGYYKNKFNILVTEAGDITVGIRTTSASDWVLWDNFKLVYQGSGANAYAETLNELITKASAVGDNGTLTAEADQKIADAITAAEDALAAGDEEGCIAAINSLNEAISFGQETIKLVEALEYLYSYTNEYRMVSVESSEETFPALMDEIGTALDDGEFESNAQVEGYMKQLKGGFVTYAQYDHLDATEEASADLSAVILMADGVDNAGNGSTYGWDITGNAGMGNGCVEFFNQDNILFSQTLYNLVPGYYRMGVQGFYRNSGYATSVTQVLAEGDTIHNFVDIFAGDVATRLANIRDDAEGYNTLVGGTTEGSWTVPASMEAANTAFENDLYHNYLQFQVAEGQTEVTIGLRKNGQVTEDWTIFDNWTLEYIGTAEPTTDPTTAIESVENEASATAIRIYSLDGRQQNKLTRGVNIIRMSNGTVRKVMVK